MSTKKWLVGGEAIVIVRKVVDAATAEDALDKASATFRGLVSYAGNGGLNKIVGVSRTGESCEPFGDVDWTDAEQLEDA